MNRRSITCSRYCPSIISGILILLLSSFFTLAQIGASPLSKEDEKAIANLVRPEVTLAARALGFAMQGKTDTDAIGPLIFKDPAAIPPVDPVIRRDKFQLSQIVTTGHEQSQNEPDLHFAGGALIHQDRYGRLIMSNYTVQFETTPGGKVAIQNASVTPLDVPLPRVYFFYVPASKISPSALKQNSFTSLLEKISRDSVLTSGKTPVDQSLKDYYVFAFLMDRLSADADMGIALVTEDDKNADTGSSKNSSSSVGSFSFDMKRSVMGSADDSKKSKGSGSLQSDGWHVAWLPARFALDGDKTVAFKILYTPGSNVPRDQRIQLLVDMYATNISATNAALVMQIQKVLTEQGYNPGPANGSLTSQTVAAIKKCQTDRRMKVDGIPTAGFYHILSDTPQMPIPADSKKAAATRRAPVQEDTLTVMKLQHWLFQAGYYKGPVNGKMNRETRNAMTAFKKKQEVDAKKNTAAAPEKTVLAKQQTTKKTVAQKPKKSTVKKKTAPKKSASKRQKPDNSAARFAAFEKAFGNKMWPNGIEQPANPETSKGYSITPEPMLFVVPSEAVKSQKLPGTYFDLLNFVAQRAISPSQGSSQEKDYVVFAFLKDKTSPSSKFLLKVSGNKRGIGGYKKGSKGLDFNGRKVSYLSGKMRLFNSEKKSLLYLKAVFTPGDEVNFFARSSRRAGLYATDGT